MEWKFDKYSSWKMVHPTTQLISISWMNSSLTVFDTNLNSTPHQESFLKEIERPNFIDNLTFNSSQMDEFPGNQVQNQQGTSPPTSVSQSWDFLVEGTEANRRLWVGPSRNPTRTISPKKRLVQAIEYLRDSTRDRDVLIQIWVPIKRGGRHVLTTYNQPFSLNSNSKSLAEYRDVSRNYQFAAEEDSKDLVGLPGRVFLNKLPEWTPDVRFFKREEYPRVDHAQQHNVSGSLALPVFERSSGNCLGVVEILTTSQKVPELENVCKALEAVDLKSSEIPSSLKAEDCNEPYRAALTEIKDVLICVCTTHKLPLAQAWAPCIQQGKGGCRHSDKNYIHCVSTIDSACYVADPQVVGFHKACSDHHLLKGEGIVGKAFMTNQPCFAEDMTVFCKTEYPLSHHARMFDLRAAVAIRLRSTYTGTADFVLEFFLPPDCKDSEDQREMLNSLSSVIKQSCQSLRVVMDQELAVETSFPKSVSLESHKEELTEEFRVTTEWDNSGMEIHYVRVSSENNIQQDSVSKGTGEGTGDFSFVSEHASSGSKRTSQKMRTKTEKTISLQVLQQYFAGSLKDAAKNIGVCPTTLKRICRQHGITRWPSRKIKKVGHSLRKLQVVMDSVQGAEGSIQLSSFYNNFPELVSPNLPGSSHLSTSKMSDHLEQLNRQPDGSLLSPGNTTSKSPSSSGSHSSSSSFCCSTGLKKSSFPFNVSSSGEALLAEQTGGMLKRARSDAELLDLGQDETKLLVRSQSHKIISEHASIEAPLPLPKSRSHVLHDVSNFRVKASFGEEKIRFSLQPNWGFGDLQREIFRRFKIDDVNKVDLKYLDDESEWVLLTCDADLEECIDIHKSSRRHTMKLSVNQSYHPSLGSSFGSNGGPF
ncbi:NLP2-like isoform X1 [Olea europaea subsp. europaea]|uniref:NLP2-like isoform X1 n=1 Tax=Olea europaea subsp. europaea TaxID=158383 RepID=A0A8S0QNY7_OLEEU|nr:NLP2-like isoform X1 [Olea europaea subsp. europaea]